MCNITCESCKLQELLETCRFSLSLMSLPPPFRREYFSSKKIVTKQMDIELCQMFFFPSTDGKHEDLSSNSRTHVKLDSEICVFVIPELRWKNRKQSQERPRKLKDQLSRLAQQQTRDRDQLISIYSHKHYHNLKLSSISHACVMALTSRSCTPTHITHKYIHMETLQIKK